MRKQTMRTSRIKAWLLALALISTAVPVYGAEPEYEEVKVSENAAAYEDEASYDAPAEDLRADETVAEDATPDESLSEDAVADEAPTYQLTYKTLADGTLEIKGLTGEAKGDLIIPEEIDGKKVTAIGNEAFKDCTGFAGKLVLPEGLTTIGDRAFMFCHHLTGKLVLPESLTSIGADAFSNCFKFTGDLVLPEDLEYMGDTAFAGCSGFNGKLVLPKHLGVLRDMVFLYCGFTGDLVLPEGLTTIGERAFQNCSGFTGELVIPNGVTTIGENAFNGCSGFTGDLVLPDGLTTIGESAFSGCTGFTGELVLPEGLTYIGGSAFSGCRGFTRDLVLPDSLMTIGDYAFRRCCFTGKLVIPDSVTTLEVNSFDDCRGFRTVTNRSGEGLYLPTKDSSSQDVTWTDAATGATIIYIANGTAIRSDAYDLSNEDNFTHSIVPDAVYTGKKIIPDITVYHGMNTLRKNKDYKITFSNNINAGTATFTITGKGLYKGTATDTFNIIEKSISENDVIISEIPMIRESGKTYTPVPTITYNKKKLKKGIDFTVKYYTDKACTGASVTPRAAGKYYVKIRGINNFKGTIEGINNSKGRDEADFEITPAAKVPVRNLAVSKIPAQKYTGAEVKPTLTVKYGKALLKQGEHYEVTYENNIEAGTATAVITGIRKKGYTGVRRVNFRIAGGSISKAVYDGFKTSFVYDGSKKKQDSLKLYKDKAKTASGNLKGINAGTYEWLLAVEQAGYDYVYSYEKNTDAGKAVMTIKGVNGWSGTVKKTYTIKPYNIKTNEGGKISISLPVTSYPFTGAAIKPEPVVKYGERTLTKGSDYTLSYANNVAVNDGTGKKKPVIKVTGKGNFSGTDASTTFVITKPTMGAAGLAIVTGGSVSGNKKGNWKAKVDVITPNGKKLKQGKDYTVRYTLDDAGETLADSNAALPAGSTIYVHVAAKPGASYTGGLKGSYEIRKYDITKLTAVVSPKVYTGKAVEIGPSDIIWKSGKKVVSDVTFEIDEASYLNNINPGKASVRVKGKDDYSGTKTVTYRIATRKILWWWV